jgi:aldehyde dehydrogenase (NAD+)
MVASIRNSALFPDHRSCAQSQPSELAPVSSALLAELLPKYLDPEAYAVINGAIEHTTKLMEFQWGHVLYTGSGNVGKIIAGAAAKTLSPSTLEVSAEC